MYLSNDRENMFLVNIIVFSFILHILLCLFFKNKNKKKRFS